MIQQLIAVHLLETASHHSEGKTTGKDLYHSTVSTMVHCKLIESKKHVQENIKIKTLFPFKNLLVFLLT